jgi:hypothetical protein
LQETANFPDVSALAKKYVVNVFIDGSQTPHPKRCLCCCCCLQETAKFPEVSALAEKHVVNVLIGGSQTSLFCNTSAPDSVCSTLYFGYTGAADNGDFWGFKAGLGFKYYVLIC